MADRRILKVLDGLDQGKISEYEANLLLKAEFGITLEQARHTSTPQRPSMHAIVPLVIVIGFLALTVIGGLFLWEADPTGFATFDVDIQGSTDTSYVINQTITSLTATGTLTGEGTATVTFVTSTGTYLLGEITSDPGTPRTDRASYLEGEDVGVEHAPGDATYYLDNGVNTTPVDLPFPAPNTSQELLIVANESGTLNTYRLPILIGEYERKTTFTDLCVETCILEPTNGTVEIVVEGGFLDIQLSGTAPGVNREPELAIPFEPVTVNGTTEILLDGHFIDEDGDGLLYSVSQSSLVGATVDGSTLTLEPLSAGSEELTIYVSDLETVVSTTISVTVPEQAPEPNVTIIIEENGTTENTTVQNVTNTTNITVQDIPEAPNVTTNGSLPALNCTASDPNQRPLDCLNLQAEKYFEENIYWESVSRQKAAKFTPIGNLHITGDVIENSNSNAGRNDFRVSFKDSDFNEQATIWIDEEGNLHLKGQLHEETHNVVPAPGSYAVINRRGVYLAYADRRSGDLHLRGSVIPYRRSIE